METLLNVGLALALGLLVGGERGWQEREAAERDVNLAVSERLKELALGLKESAATGRDRVPQLGTGTSITRNPANLSTLLV